MEQKIWKWVGNNVVLAKGKEGGREGGWMEMSLIRGKLSIKSEPENHSSKIKRKKGFKNAY